MNIHPWKLFRWFRRLQLWATGDWKLHYDNALIHASHLMQFFGKTSNHPGGSAPLQPRVGPLWLLAFPKTKTTFEKEEISNHQWDSGECNGAANGGWGNCVRSQSANFEGDWGVIVLCTMFFISSSITVSTFHNIWLAGYFLDRPHILFSMAAPK